MATNCYGARRLSDLLQEQQEPFLLLLDDDDDEPPRCSPVESRGRRLRDLTKALLQCDLAACFSFGCGARLQRFRRLPRDGGIAGRCGDDGPLEEVDCGRQLSPVSVMDLLHSSSSDEEEESPVRLSHWDEDEDSDVRPSTSPSASSPPSDHDHLPGTPPCSTFFVTSNGKIIRALDLEVEADGNDDGNKRSLKEMGRSTVSGWERIAADIARIPTLVALDLSASAREWRQHVAAGEAEEEARRRVGRSIEAMIFEEVRWEAVRDMICLREL